MIDAPRRAEVEEAAKILSPVLVTTPLVPLSGDDRILLKPEIHQRVGSFKIRGVYHAVASMAAADRDRGLSTVSAGNTAQALAWCGRHFGVPARSLMPEGAPRAKIEAVERYGGEPILVPTEEVFDFLREHRWEHEPYAFVHPWIDRRVLVGHATIGLELLNERDDLDTVFVPVGGGGLIGGVGGMLRAAGARTRVVAVEPEGCPALHRSLRAGRPVHVSCETICDGVAVPYITDEMFPLLRDIVDEVVLVSEHDVRLTIRRLALDDHIVVEGSAALSVAAAVSMTRKRRGMAACLITGGSIDASKLGSILLDAQNPLG